MSDISIKSQTEQSLWKLELEMERGNRPLKPKRCMAWGIVDRRGKIIALGFGNKSDLWKDTVSKFPIERKDKVSYAKELGFRCVRVSIVPPETKKISILSDD